MKQAAAGKGVKIKVRDIKTSLVEALISRGDGRLAGLFEELHAKGVRLEAWTEYFDPGLYDEWFARQDGLAASLLGARKKTDALPWDFIDTGVDGLFS